MSEIPETYNPYQPPAVCESPDVRMAEDTEFLISDHEILCRETVILPKICIRTGETNDVEMRHRLFHLVAGIPAMVIFISMIGLFFVLAATESLLAIGVSLLGLIGAMFLQPILVRIRAPGILTVDATWYVSRRYLQHARRRTRLLRLGLVSVVTSAVFLLTLEDGWHMASIASLTAAAGSGLLCLFIRPESGLQFSGRRRLGIHKGLMVLTGHTRHFTNAVNQIIHGHF